MIHDISVPIHNGMHVWPSDPGVRIEGERHVSADGSHHVRLTTIHCGSHTGTHVDAPSHMMDSGGTLSDLGLDALVGPARVVELGGVRSIGRRELAPRTWRGVERVLFKTDNSAHWADETFFTDFVYLEPDGARFLVEQGVRLVGIDYLSIDRYKASDHPSHFILLERSIVILEGLDLRHVPAGDYQLVALPMKLEGADGAPVRAILVS